MAKQRGIRRDSHLTNQRRLRLVQRLLRGPARAGTLIADLRAALGDDIYPADARAALRHDLAALRETFGCTFIFRRDEGYILTDPGMLTLLDPAEDELEALALLFAAIDEGVVPPTAAGERLKAHILALIPREHDAQLAQAPQHMRLEAPTRTTPAVDALIARLRPMLGKSEITFQYRSPYTAPDHREQHRVAPYELLQRDGSTYLDAYCLDSDLKQLRGRYIPYRLDRIVPNSVRRLPRRLAPIRYARRSYNVRYTLAPAVAGRRDLMLWFSGSTCTYADDGSAVVEACVTDLWYARNVLLRYREHCRVWEPPELVAMMRESITSMAQLYLMDADDEGAAS